jgi:hypothetical protein
VLAFTALLVLVAARALTAQNPRDRTLFVSVVDKTGTPVTDLGSRDFIVREDGATREILRVTPATDPFDVALLVDNSAALGNDVVYLRQGLTRFLDVIYHAAAPGSGDELLRDPSPKNREEAVAMTNTAVIGLAARPTILVDYTSSGARLKAAIGALFPQTYTGMTLLDALVEVSKGLERRDTPRAAIVVVVTAGPELGRYDDRTIITALKKAGVLLSAVTVGNFAATTPDEMRYRGITLAKGTDQTGGQWDALLAGSGLPRALDKLAHQLTTQYKVVYSRPESLIPPEHIEVSVTRSGLTAHGIPERRPGGQR